ncbi:MAG: type II secretion system F family protein [Actinobacteria bacterium]|nr:type II secretion system F family protein [Actinomycetota bacterium]
MTALLAGAGAGLGGFLVLRGLVPPHPPLARSLARIERVAPAGGSDRERGLQGRAFTTFEALGLDVVALGADLRAIGREPARHALDKLLLATVFSALPLFSGLVLAGFGLGLPGGVVFLAAVTLGAGGFFLPDVLVRGEARLRRREFRHALSAYMDLVTIVIAGGGGTESALTAAASAGSGWAFTELRRALSTARLRAEPPWVALDRLGADLAVVELREVAASLGLAGEHGAKVRNSLATRARSLREHRLAEVETEAQAATEKMSLPVVLMLFGFLAFVLYPALHFVLDGL